MRFVEGQWMRVVHMQVAGCISLTKKGSPKCLDLHPIIRAIVYAKGSSPMYTFKSHVKLK